MPIHSAQTLYDFAFSNPLVMRRVQATFRTLAKHKKAGAFDHGRAYKLILNNVRDAARIYVQYHGENLSWPLTFPEHVRHSCAERILAQFHQEGVTPHDDLARSS